MQPIKKRADVLLFENGLVPSRERGRAAIMAGLVRANGRLVAKAGDMFAEGAVVFELTAKEHPYVGRGGVKLAEAIRAFNIDFTQLAVLDIGASTGGFTDCALQNGAVKVFALDVGYGQLAWELRQDPRVVVIERTNIRNYDGNAIPELVDAIVADVSFISLVKIIPAALRFLKADGWLVCLVKPQFEAGRAKVGKGGIVRDPAVHIEVLDSIYQMAAAHHLSVRGLTNSPITGADGNIEYLIMLVNKQTSSVPAPDFGIVVNNAFEQLKHK